MKWIKSEYQGIRFATKETSKLPFLAKYYVKKIASSGSARHRPVQKSFSTERKRVQWAEGIDSERTQSGLNSTSLDLAMRKKWETAQAILGDGVDPIEVALEWKSSQVKASKTPSSRMRINEIISKFTDAASTGRSADKIHHNAKMFDRLRDRYGNEFFISFSRSTDDIELWINTLPFAQRTKINHYKQYKEIFAWAYRHRMISEDPFQRVKAPENSDVSEIEYMPVEDVVRLFQANYSDADLCGLLALNIFGGIRSSAVSRIEAKELDFDKRTLFTPAWKTKKSRSHLLERQPETMWLWLERASESAFHKGCKNHRNPTEQKLWKRKVDRTWRWKKFKALRDAGLAASPSNKKKKNSLVSEKPFAPPSNWARHSFATYHCAAFRDLNETANLLSHGRTIETLEQHYKGIASEEEGKRFFAITPDFISNSIKNK